MNIESIVKISALRFPVKVKVGEHTSVVYVILTKEQLQAAQIIGESSKEVIQRFCSRNGYEVLNIGKAERKTLEINLNELWEVEA